MRVLIVDDDPVYRALLEQLLADWGFECITAGDGAEAWDILQGNPDIRLVILDWQMPEMDGYEVCRRLTEGEAPSIYTILVTSSYHREEIMKVVVAGADDYIIKPFEPLDMKIRVRNAVRMLDLRQEMASARAAAG